MKDHGIQESLAETFSYRFHSVVCQTCRTPHIHGSWGNVVDLNCRIKRVMLKEVIILSYLDYPIPVVSAPAA